MDLRTALFRAVDALDAGAGSEDSDAEEDSSSSELLLLDRESEPDREDADEE
jgi:hypothetical protein